MPGLRMMRNIAYHPIRSSTKRADQDAGANDNDLESEHAGLQVDADAAIDDNVIYLNFDQMHGLLFDRDLIDQAGICSANIVRLGKYISLGESIVNEIALETGFSSEDSDRVRNILRSKAPDLFQEFAARRGASELSPAASAPTAARQDIAVSSRRWADRERWWVDGWPDKARTSPTLFILHVYGNGQAAQLPTIVDVARADPELAKAFKEEVGKTGFDLPGAWPFPTWRKDKRPDDTPPDFIKRHYGHLLGHGLVRADVGLDPQLYAALAAWFRPDPETGRRNTLPPDCPLPTQREVTDAKASQLGMAEDGRTTLEASPAWRTREALRRRMQRQK